ncbi:MAG: T9SS type A sorting domain-containing protein [Bacteroidetes bacterium]|nr:T9SS type A sorting domain-containing protein [Bacteroidota bacterium]
MKKLFPTIFILVFLSPRFAHAQAGPYWATDVAPIFYANCTKCHNPNGIAPFPLITFSDAVNNSTNMVSQVSTGKMPPWPPDTTYNRFCGERKLSQAQIQTVVDWVNNGMQSGNLANAPTPPTYSGAALITNPDLTSQMPNYTVNTMTGGDLYRCFVMPSGISTTEYITSIEVLPGNRNIVHHVLIYQDQASTCVTLDNNDPGPGYTWFGDVGSPTATLIGGWVPGQGVYTLPTNMGIKLNPNSYIIMQVHYPAGTNNLVDSTQVRFVFSTGAVRNVTLSPLINYWSTMTDGPLDIPADSIKTFHAQFTTNFNGTFISCAPHMHLLGKVITNYAVTPSNDTVPLVRINDWSFHWQGFYNFRQLVHLPMGTKLYASATYDNTTNNPDNPNNPTPQEVYAGENTTDEMMIVYYAFTPYQAGDENIWIDSTVMAVPPVTAYGDVVKTPQLYDPFPSPSGPNENVNVQFFLPKDADVKFELFDVNGRSVFTENNSGAAGFGNEKINLHGLATGTYVLRMTADGTVRTKKVVVE